MSHFTVWENDFDRITKGVIAVDKKIMHEAADILAKVIKDATPVGYPPYWKPPIWPKGYIPGTLKKSWVTIHQESKVIIQNETVYAYRVEHGWSHLQAPLGMMRVSLFKWPQILKEMARKIKR